MTDPVSIEVSQAEAVFEDLIEQVAQGVNVILLRNGKPVAKLLPVEAAQTAGQQRLGFMKGASDVPDDFDRMGQAEIEDDFSGED